MSPVRLIEWFRMPGNVVFIPVKPCNGEPTTTLSDEL